MDYLTRTWVKGQLSTGLVETLSQIRNPGNRHVYCGAIKTFRSRGTRHLACQTSWKGRITQETKPFSFDGNCEDFLVSEVLLPLPFICQCHLGFACLYPLKGEPLLTSSTNQTSSGSREIALR